MNPVATPSKIKSLFSNTNQSHNNITPSQINLNHNIQNYINNKNKINQLQYKTKSKQFHQSCRKQQILSLFKQSRQKQYQTQIKIKNIKIFITITQNILNDLINKEYFDELQQIIINNKIVKLDKDNFQYVMKIIQRLYQQIIKRYQNKLQQQTQRQKLLLYQQSLKKLLHIIVTHNSLYILQQLIFPSQHFLSICLRILTYKNTYNYFLSSTIKLILDILSDLIILAFNTKYLIQNGLIKILAEIKQLNLYQEKILLIILNLFNHQHMKIQQENILEQIKNIIINKHKGIYSKMIKDQNGQYSYQSNYNNIDNNNYYHTTYHNSYNNNVKKNQDIPIITKKYFSSFHDLINDLNRIISPQLKNNPISHQLSLHFLSMLKVSYRSLINDQINQQQKKQQQQQQVRIINPKKYISCIKILLTWLQSKPLSLMLTTDITTIIHIYQISQDITFNLQDLNHHHKQQINKYSLLTQQQKEYYIIKQQPKHLGELQNIVYLFIDILQSIIKIMTDKYMKIAYEDVCEIVNGLILKIYNKVQNLENSAYLLLIGFNLINKISIIQQKRQRKFTLSNQQRLTLQYKFQRQIFQNIHIDHYNHYINNKNIQDFNYNSNINNIIQILKQNINKILYIYYKIVVYTQYTQLYNRKYPQVQSQIISLTKIKLTVQQKRYIIFYILKILQRLINKCKDLNLIKIFPQFSQMHKQYQQILSVFIQITLGEDKQKINFNEITIKKLQQSVIKKQQQLKELFSIVNDNYEDTQQIIKNNYKSWYDNEI